MYKEIGITVLMCVFKEPEDWLVESIESILGQTYEDFEFLIVNDDPSSEVNLRILSQYSLIDNRIKVINNAVNLGLTKSLNVGLQQSKGKYVVRMDSDDISLFNRLKIQFEFMEANPKCVVSGCYVITTAKKESVAIFPTQTEEVKAFLLLDNCIPHPTAIIRRDILVRFNLRYNEGFRFTQDYAFWCTLASYGELRNIAKPLLKYRISEGQISSSRRAEQKELAKEIRLEYLKTILRQWNIDGNDNYLLRLKDVGKFWKFHLKQAYYLNLDKSLFWKIIAILRNGDIQILSKKYVKILLRDA